MHTMRRTLTTIGARTRLLAALLAALLSLMPLGAARAAESGTVVAWGQDNGGQVSGRPTDAGYTAIAAGNVHSLALRQDGTVVAWGLDHNGQVSSRPTEP